MLITDPKKLKELKSSDRYDPSAKDGISPRWLPGARAATYCAQGDEHSADGTVDESAKNAVEQIDKRMCKVEALKKSLPEPELFIYEDGKWIADSGKKTPDVLLIGWGSTKPTAMDVLEHYSLPATSYPLIGYLHFTYLWPLRTEKLMTLATSAKKLILVEGNHQGQLGMLIRQETGLSITDRILKYDGRPFFFDELGGSVENLLKKNVSSKKGTARNPLPATRP